MVKYFGFVVVNYLMDWFHLFDTGLTDTFGEHGCNLIQGELSQITNSQTEEYFYTDLSNSRILLSNQQQRDMDLEKKMEAFAEHKYEYVQFYINNMHGLRWLHGSSMSRKNHSRTLCRINKDNTKIKKYCEQTINLVKDIFGRQQRRTLIMNKILYDVYNGFLNEIEELNGTPRSWENVNLLVAAKKLAFPEYDRLKLDLKHVDEEYLLSSGVGQFCL